MKIPDVFGRDTIELAEIKPRILRLIDAAIAGARSKSDDVLDSGDYELAEKLGTLGELLVQERTRVHTGSGEAAQLNIADALSGLEQLNRITEPLEEIEGLRKESRSRSN